ncbi:rhamnan synthesis F family protein [Geothrix sp. 21YS21S-2]|uniref:rhamnan synthesis F family protein n=1 Tax=Geothrix sp. 21YS21S-2 TaxID=3068893 RepID=UPI0027BA0598|nr:rhamnan synthesis F family protein [Geothrix sp. 21YS21S-2]
MIRIAQVGTFDVDNLGDLLFPVVFSRILAEVGSEWGMPIECSFFSPQGLPEGTLYRDQIGTLPLGDLDRLDSENPFDLIFIGGGDIVRDDDSSLAAIYGPNGSNLGFSHLMSPTRRPDPRLVLLMAGVPFALEADFRAYLANSFSRLRLAAVRDRVSARRLSALVPANLRVLPDLVRGLAHIHSRTELLGRKDSLVPPNLAESGYLCFQTNAAPGADVGTIGQALLQLEQRTGLPVVLMEMGRTGGEGMVLTRLEKRFHFRYARQGTGLGSVLQRVAAIAGSRGFLGSSLHGAILAHTYGVPHFSYAGGSLDKIRGFYECCGTGLCFPDFHAFEGQLPAIAERICGSPVPDAPGPSDDYSAIKGFILEALSSVRDGKPPPAPYVRQVDKDYQRSHTRRQWRLDARITRLRFPALAIRHPRIHLAVIRAIKLAWWTVSFQLLARYRQRRDANHSVIHESALVTPLPWLGGTDRPAPSIAVVCHLYYDTLADEIRTYLLHIPFGFDLFITTDTEVKRRSIEKAFLDWNQGRVEVRLAENRGRDIAPMLITCADVFDRYEFFLHIHGKRSPYGKPYTHWRKYLLDTLVGSAGIVSSVFEIFHELPNVGMIGPQNPKWIRPQPTLTSDYDLAVQFHRRIGLELDFRRRIEFPAGSMFWGRSLSLRKLLDAGLTLTDFAPELGQTGETLAHLIEHLFFRICEGSGYSWLKIAHPLQSGENRELVRLTRREEMQFLLLPG